MPFKEKRKRRIVTKFSTLIFLYHKDKDNGEYSMLDRHYPGRLENFWKSTNFFPGENNLVLWQRRDFGNEQKDGGKVRWLERFSQSFIG